jgi:hypothetical protein
MVDAVHEARFAIAEACDNPVSEREALQAVEQTKQQLVSLIDTELFQAAESEHKKRLLEEVGKERQAALQKRSDSRRDDYKNEKALLEKNKGTSRWRDGARQARARDPEKARRRPGAFVFDESDVRAHDWEHQEIWPTQQTVLRLAHTRADELLRSAVGRAFVVTLAGRRLYVALFYPQCGAAAIRFPVIHALGEPLTFLRIRPAVGYTRTPVRVRFDRAA